MRGATVAPNGNSVFHLKRRTGFTPRGRASPLCEGCTVFLVYLWLDSKTKSRVGEKSGGICGENEAGLGKVDDKNKGRVFKR